MDFNVNNAARSYQSVRSALQKTAAQAEQTDQSRRTAIAAVQEFATIIENGEKTAVQHLTTGADPHAVVEAIAAAELAVETAVTVRNKIVEAYQELLRMPI